MADFEEMKNAVQRALLHASFQYLSFCNSCKSEYNQQEGTTVEIPSSSAHYTIWYCDQCSNRTLELV